VKTWGANAETGELPIAARATRVLLAACAVIPLWSLVPLGAPIPGVLLVLGFLLLSLVRPRLALVALAAIVPLGQFPARVLGSTIGFTEPIVLAFLGGWLLHGATRGVPAPASRSKHLTAAALFATAVAASSAVQLIVIHVFVDYPLAYLQRVFTFLHQDYFRLGSAFQPLPDGMLPLECLGIFWAAVELTRNDRRLARHLAGSIVAGVTAAAAITLVQFGNAALHENPSLQALISIVRTNRFATGFKDYNAAGSTLALALPLAVGFVSQARRSVPLRLAMVALMLGGLWLSASRVAVVAASVALVGVVAYRAVRKRRAVAHRAVLVVALVGALASAVAAPLFVARPLLLEVGGRLEMARAALKMTATAPVFGVGIGRFYALSSDFIGPALRKNVPRENAHNNFLQVLAELGVVGLAAFLWLLWSAGLAIARSAPSPADASWRYWSVGGIVAFLLTCLAGHPLLVLPAACVFWLALGITVPPDTAAPTRDEAPRRWSRRARLAAAWLVGAALVCSIPFRASHALARLDLTYARMGLSGLHHDATGVPYRWMWRQGRVFVPADAALVAIPLRLAGGKADVRILVDGRVRTEVTIDGTQWWEATFRPPPRQRGTFVPVDVRLGALHQEPDEEGGRTPGTLGVQVGQPHAVR
jgi:O-antigen ligase